MSVAKPKPPSTNCGHAGAAIARVHDGCSTIGGIMLMIMTTGVAVTVGSPAHIMVPANDLTVRNQNDRTKNGNFGAAGWDNRSLTRNRVGRRRLALSAITGGQS